MNRWAIFVRPLRGLMMTTSFMNKRASFLTKLCWREPFQGCPHWRLSKLVESARTRRALDLAGLFVRKPAQGDNAPVDSLD